VAKPTVVKYEDLHTYWDKTIELTLRRQGFWEYQALADMKGMIYVEFIAGGYLDIYNPQLSKFSTFLHAFIVLRCRRERTKNARDIIRRALRIEESLQDEPSDYNRRGVIDAGVVEDPRGGWNMLAKLDTMQDKEWLAEKVGKVRKKLERIPPKKFSFKRDMDPTAVSMLNLFNWLLVGVRRKDIALRFGYSEASVSIMVRELRDIQEVLTFREEVKEHLAWRGSSVY